MTDNFDLKFKKAHKYIEQAQNILLLTHFNPDGDGLSSLCAMAEYLNNLNKTYFAYCHNQPPTTYDFLQNIEKINFTEVQAGAVIKSNNQPLIFAQYDLILVFDCGSLSRTKITEQLLTRRQNQIVIEFDHHPKVDDYADVEIRDTTAAATAEIIFNFFKTNRLHINKTIANTLMTGLITDTANFLYSSASARTIKTASELLSFGAQLPRLTDLTMRNKSLEAMKLWGKIMSNLQINQKYNIAFTVLAEEEYLKNNIDKEELEGVSGFLSNLYGVKALMFIREEGDGIIRGSLRTAQPNIDISKLAKLLGGGGHPKASGFSFPGKLVQTNSGWRVI